MSIALLCILMIGKLKTDTDGLIIDVGSFTFFLLSNDYTIHNLIYQLISCHKACPLNECVDFTLKIHLNSMKNSCFP